MPDELTTPPSDEHEPVIERPRISRWVWKPWYAKVWWSLIAIYWAGAAGALFLGPLRHFYGSNLAGLLNIALYPVFALFSLSIGWMIAWKDALDFAALHPEVENNLGWRWSTRPYDFHGERMRRHNNPTDPTSPSYIANATLRMFRR